MGLNTILSNETAPIVCGEAMRDYLLDCTMRQASRLWDSGAVRTSPRATEFAESCDKQKQYKFWKPVDYAPGGIPTCGLAQVPGDADCAPCHGLEQGAETLFKLYSRHCWAMDDCEAQVMGCSEDDVIDVVVNNLVTPFNVRDRVDAMFSEFAGLYNAAAADADLAEDMIIDLGDNCLDACAGVDLNMLRGCGAFNAMYVHQDVYKNMKKTGCLTEKVCCGEGNFDFLALADGTAIIPVTRDYGNTFMVDPADGCYISFAFNFGAFEYAEGCVKTPTAVDRDESANCGAGAETVYFRSEFVIRPIGTTFNTSAIAADYANPAELSDGANWTIDIPVDDFGIAFVKSCCTA